MIVSQLLLLGDTRSSFFYQTLLPEDAHWLASFKSELLAFPAGRYDDQVDALSQLVNWHTRRIDDYDSSLMDGPQLVDQSDWSPDTEVSWDAYLDAWGAG